MTQSEEDVFGRKLFVDDFAVSLKLANPRKQNNLTMPAIKEVKKALDWICPSCSKVNFSRRQKCFTCGVEKSIYSNVREVEPASRSFSRKPNLLFVASDCYAQSQEEITACFRSLGVDLASVRLDTSIQKAYVECKTVSDFDAIFSLYATDQRDNQGRFNICGVNMILNKGENKASSENSFFSSSAGPNLGQLSLVKSTSVVVSSSDTSVNGGNGALAIPKGLPTPFERGGMSYALDSSSGWFFEEKSGFYYDFQSKVYYKASDKKYYKYNENFSELVECERDGVDSNENKTIDAEVKKEGGRSVKEKIPISFKFNVPETLNIANGDEIDIRHVEKVVETKVAFEKPKKANVREIKVSEDAEKWKEASVKMNTNNKICLLCRRKFKSEKALEKHVTKSELHKENLKKQKAGDIRMLPISMAEPKTVHQATLAATVAGYKDRAGDRRQDFNQTIREAKRFIASKKELKQKNPGAEKVKALSKSRMKSSEPDMKSVPLHERDDNNKGVSLLQKFGWAPGKGLGKTEQGIKAPIEAKGRKKPRK